MHKVSLNTPSMQEDWAPYMTSFMRLTKKWNCTTFVPIGSTLDIDKMNWKSERILHFIIDLLRKPCTEHIWFMVYGFIMSIPNLQHSFLHLSWKIGHIAQLKSIVIPPEIIT